MGLDLLDVALAPFRIRRPLPEKTASTLEHMQTNSLADRFQGQNAARLMTNVAQDDFFQDALQRDAFRVQIDVFLSSKEMKDC